MRNALLTSTALLFAAGLTGCSLSGGEDSAGTDESSATSSSAAAESGPVVLLTHDSFELPEELIARFEKETGRTLTVRPSGDAGELTTKLALTAGNPDGDAAFGVDTTFASRALTEDVFAPVDVELPSGAESYMLPEGGDRMHPIDVGNVCVNVDNAWFEKEGVPAPETFEDLTKPEYRGLFVTEGATTSSPGLAFLLATVAEYGEDWPAYWEDLMANDTQLAKGWEDAYYVDFTYSGGDRPIVTSYDSSPAFTVDEETGESTTSALLDTCFEQVEYAGVLDGTENPQGAQQVVEFLLSEQVQEQLPDSMYVLPVRDDVELPTAWAEFAPQATDPATLDPAEIAENREAWLTEWTDVTTR